MALDDAPYRREHLAGVSPSSVERSGSILTLVHALLVAITVLLALSPLTVTGRVAAQARDLAAPWGPSASSQSQLPPPPSAPADELGVEAPGAGEPSIDELVPPPPDGYAPPQLAAAVSGAAERGSDLRLRSSISTRLRSLDADLQVLAARGSGGVVDGVLAIVMGATSVGIGLFMDLSGSAPAPSIAGYLYLYGGAGIARGILDFVFMQNPANAAITYTHMPMTTLAEVRARLRYGERELESLANNAQISRILDGGLSIATGLAVIPVYLGPNNFSISQPFDYFVLIGAAISATTGVITLFSTNEAERRWGAYRELRDRLLTTEQGAADEAELEAAVAQLEAFERRAVGGELRPVFAGSAGGFVAGATGTF
ncbi:MAG: hypothetical protein OHK0013_45120 [Sandaracinaceae bacterium]